MRLAVCESPAELDPAGRSWRTFADRARAVAADILLLNEMPFGSWIAARPTPDATWLEDSQRVHEAGIARLGDLGTPAVLGTRPVIENGRAVNEAFVLHETLGLVGAHTKQFFPDEEGYYEARWFVRGPTHFDLVEIEGLRVGFLICTDVMFNEWARRYGRMGADLIVVPRATPRPSTRRWKTAVSMAAIVSGCWVASSNRGGRDTHGQEFGGAGWIVDPYGDTVAQTSPVEPVVAAEIDPARARAAKQEYPCYVAELE